MREVGEGEAGVGEGRDDLLELSFKLGRVLSAAEDEGCLRQSIWSHLEP